MEVRFNVEVIDNGLLVTAGGASSASDPLAQRGPAQSRVYCADPSAFAAHAEGIMETAIAAAGSHAVHYR